MAIQATPAGAKCGFLAGLLVLLAAALLFPASRPFADEMDPSRESSNLSVIGVGALDEPRGESFEMLQYMPDPIEGFNRGSLKYAAKPFVDWLVLPAAKGWRFVSPEPVRGALENFEYNITFPSRLVSLLLQGQPRKSAVETGHFLVNTTVGIAGLFDVASRWEIPTYRQDVGLAFAKWGSGPGFYFMIPLLGPSSGRDALGRVFDTALNPLTYLFGANLLFNVNAFTSKVDGYEALRSAEADMYLALRALWSIQRGIEVEGFEIAEEDYASSDPEPSLGVLLLKNYDPHFPALDEVGAVDMPNTGRELPYSLWLQDQPAPLVFLIPGIGAHRTSRNAAVLAELAFDDGFSVVNVSSPFHPEFVLNGLTEPYPGYTPSDAEDLYTALSLIHGQVVEEHPGMVTSTYLAGYSLGGIEALHIAAAQERRGPDALRFERFVALNPPIDLRHAARQFDGYFDAPLRWPADERDQRIKELAMKSFLVLREGLEEGRPLPLDRVESEFLIGLQGRTTLVATLEAVRERTGQELRIRARTEAGRGVLHSLLNETTLQNYGDQLLVPHYAAKLRLSRSELERAASLRSIEQTLRSDDRVRIITNADDFIVTPEALSWLRGVMGERLTVFPSGGHMGNLHLREVQNAVSLAIRGQSPSDLMSDAERGR